MRIVEIIAYPISYPIAEKDQVRLGIGKAIKRDAVIVKVTTESGLVGYGESHHGRSPGSIAHLINTTLRQLVMGMEATDVVGIWKRIYKMQLSSHGMGSATSMAMSGIDQALWDIRGKAVGWPIYRLLGGSNHPIPAYAGGVALGYQSPESLVDSAQELIQKGYKAIKIRVGDTLELDSERIDTLRKNIGDKISILTDANTNYTVADVRSILPIFVDNKVDWLEEPFPPHDYRSYQTAANFSAIPLAAGENHYTRFEFNRLIEDKAVTIIQPDMSKTGGLTEALRIASLASAYKLNIHPHTSMTGINMAVTIHFLSAIDNSGYFEADVSKNNLFRDELVTSPYSLEKDGTVRPIDRPGIGIEVDEDFIGKHPVIDGPMYI
jgi:D-galactarolactone cycloisomerase